MAAKEHKLGTFGGVYTPSLLTILGVIMYLRLPWIVGNAGLLGAVSIILVAHVISFSTGLSISSIATDKSVGAGGPYYIISRSLGLPIGGTIGLTLFVGLAFSISLYVIGFCESFLSFWGLDTSIASVRIAGSITIVALTVVTFISTALAVKTQYLIFALIALSLGAIFLGAPEPVAAEPNLSLMKGGASLPVLFAIFFPAVTGFTAGVNMSGDLKNPKGSIPRGTMAAIASGLVVYLSLAIYVGYRVPREKLVEDQDVLLHISLFAPAVVAGIWGATLSSALGSILGAPRILQAMSRDGITPRFFAKGYGLGAEPRNALIIAFAIGEAGILIGELDAIARIVSMVFLALYTVLNLSCAIESWANPDFRPALRIPKLVSLIGAVTAVVIMIQLDLLAMLGATAIMAGLFLFLTRRQLRLESGDVWEGIWASVVRSGLSRLGQHRRQRRQWRPNILAFGGESQERQAGLGAIGESLLGSTGMLTRIEVASGGEPSEPVGPQATEARGEPPPLGVFQRRVTGEDFLQAIPAISRYHGLSGFEPNTVLLDWSTFATDCGRFAKLLQELASLDKNQLIFAESTDRAPVASPRIDVWWQDGAGNLQLSLSLVRFLTTSAAFERAKIRFLLISDDAAASDILRASARRHLAEQRVDADIRAIDNSLDPKPIEEWVRRESGDASLALVPLPNAPGQGDSGYLSRMGRLADALSRVLFFRASPSFEDLLSAGPPSAVSLLPRPPGEVEADAPLIVDLPETPALAQAVEEHRAKLERAVRTLDEHGIRRVHAANIELVRRVKRILEQKLGQVDRGTSVRHQQHGIGRALGAFLLEAREAIERFEKEGLEKQRAILAGRIEAFLADDALTVSDPEHWLSVRRARANFKAAEGDSPYLKRFKRRRRFFSPFGGFVRYRIPEGRLRSYYRQKAVDELLKRTVDGLVSDSHRLALRLGKVLSAARAHLGGALAEAGDDGSFERHFEEQRERAYRELDQLIARSRQRGDGHRQRLLADTRELLQAYANDIDRLDLGRFSKRERRIDKEARVREAALVEIPRAFHEHQLKLLARARLAIQVSAFQRRLAELVRSERDAVVLELEGGALRDCRAVRDTLASFLERLAGGKNDVERPSVELEVKEHFEPRHFVERLMAGAQEATADLPESVETLTDESIELLEEGSADAPEVVVLELRRLAQFLVETELIGGIQDELERVPAVERRAVTIAQDVVRLLSFQVSEFDSLGFGEPGAFRAHMKPVVENGLERLSAELTTLEPSGARLAESIDRQLESVLERMDPYGLTRASSGLEQHIRLHQSRKAVSGAQGFLRRGTTAFKKAMVSTLYRASAGVVLARSLKAKRGTSGSVVDGVLSLVSHNSPRSEVLRALPFYYRQLFLGHALSETFWVDREGQLEQARRVMEGDRPCGALLVTGERGSGKTALCQRLATKVLAGRPLSWVRPPRGGSADPAEFKRALERALGSTGSYKQIFDRLQPGSVLVLDDLELWWERSARGVAVIDAVLELVARHGDRCLFVLSMGRHALSLVDRFRAVSDSALSLLECTPLPAETLGAIISLRHGSTGVRFTLGSKDEGSLSQWQLARLFSQHFNYSNGCVGAALASWLTHVDEATKDSLAVRAPQGHAGAALDELRLEWTTLLIELVLHKGLTRPRLARVTGLAASDLEHEIAALVRMGLLVEDHRVLELNRFVQHIVVERLERRGFLA